MRGLFSIRLRGPLMMCWFRSLVARIPLPLVPTVLGICTLATIYDGIGYSLVRWIAVVFGTIVALLYCCKVLFYFRDTVRQEYAQPMLSALYPTVNMLIMVLCVFYAQWLWWPCAVVFFAMFFLQLLHIVIFFTRFFVRRFEWETFLPSWYVTTHGIMITTVAGLQFMPQWAAQAVVIWGIVIYFAMTPFMVYRMACCEVKADMYHSQAIILGPCSLCTVSLVNVYPDPNALLLGVLYVCVLASLVWVVAHLPKFFLFGFKPGYAGMTFPMVIAIMASMKVSGVLAENGMDALAWWAMQLSGVQLVITTAIIAVVISYFVHYFVQGVKKDAATIRSSCEIRHSAKLANCCDVENPAE